MNRKEIKEHILKNVASDDTLKIQYTYDTFRCDAESYFLEAGWCNRSECYTLSYDVLKYVERDFAKLNSVWNEEEIEDELGLDIASIYADEETTLRREMKKEYTRRIESDWYLKTRSFKKHELDKLVAFIYYNFLSKEVIY